MRIAIVGAIIIVKFVVYDYYKYYGIVSIAKEIAQERAKSCQANWDTRRYILPPWEESTVHLWIEYCMDIASRYLNIKRSGPVKRDMRVYCCLSTW